MIDRKYIDDHHVVARFLANQLSEIEQKAFQKYFLEHPDVLVELEAGANFKLGLRTLHASDELAVALERRPWFVAPGWFALAASAILVLVMATFAMTRQPGQSAVLASSAAGLSDAAGRALPTGPAFSVLRTRSRRNEIRILVPADRQVIELRILPEEVMQSTQYQVSLARVPADDAAKRMIGTLSNLVPESDGFVSLFMQSTSLEPGIYELTISRQQAGKSEETSTFFLRAIKQDEEESTP